MLGFGLIKNIKEEKPLMNTVDQDVQTGSDVNNRREALGCNSEGDNNEKREKEKSLNDVIKMLGEVGGVGKEDILRAYDNMSNHDADLVIRSVASEMLDFLKADSIDEVMDDLSRFGGRIIGKMLSKKNDVQASTVAAAVIFLVGPEELLRPSVARAV